MIIICYLITVLLADKVKIEHLKEIIVKYKLDFVSRDCPAELLKIRRNINCYSLFKRHCDCDSPIGLLSRKDTSMSRSKIKNLRKNPNISEEEIKRLNQQNKFEIIESPEVSLLHNFLLEFLSKKASKIGLFIHWDSDPLRFHEETQVKSSDISNLLLASLKVNVLYEFISA